MGLSQMADDMRGGFSSLKIENLSIPTYRAGLLQSLAYRGLKQHLHSHLAQHDLVMPEWAVLGLLHDHGCLRLAALAEFMQVEPSLSTTLVNKLERRGLVERRPDPHDSRAKQVSLTAQGAHTVSTVEKQLRTSMKEYTAGISDAELVIYLNVLLKLTAKVGINSQKSIAKSFES